jgi:hypothetical protein
MIYNWKRKMEGWKSEDVPTSVKVPKPQVPDLQAKIASLERVIGRQALELDFFEGALRRIKETDQKSRAGGATSSTPRSEVGCNRKAD